MEHGLIHAHGTALSPAAGFWANLLIGLSYVVISACLAALVIRLRRELPYRWLFGLFGLFIIACGAGHLAVVGALGNRAPMIDLSIVVVTAGASVGTAMLMPFLVPVIANALRESRAAQARQLEIAALSEANRAKAAFMASMSHELRTPLNAILGYAQILDAEIAGPLAPGQREHISRIARAGNHLRSLIDDVLDFERLSTGRWEPQLAPVSAAEVIDEAVLLARPQLAAHQLSLEVGAPPADLLLVMDARAVKQILLNLLSNAIKYTPRGHVTLEARWADGTLSLVVIDTGIGITEDDRRHVFDAFWQADQRLTREAGGAGLGLTITRTLVERLGGTIALTSQVGVGTRVEIRLPCERAVKRVPIQLVG